MLVTKCSSLKKILYNKKRRSQLHSEKKLLYGKEKLPRLKNQKMKEPKSLKLAEAKRWRPGWVGGGGIFPSVTLR